MKNYLMAISILSCLVIAGCSAGYVTERPAEVPICETCFTRSRLCVDLRRMGIFRKQLSLAGRVLATTQGRQDMEIRILGKPQ